MAINYGITPTQQDPNQPFIPQSYFVNPAAASAPMGQPKTGQPLQQVQNSNGFKSGWDSAPDAIKTNILKDASQYHGSGAYNSYVNNALDRYNQFESQYGAGQTPWAMQQPGFGGQALFGNLPYGSQNITARLGAANQNGFGVNTYNPYSGQNVGSYNFNNPIQGIRTGQTPFGGQAGYNGAIQNSWDNFNTQAQKNSFQGLFPDQNAYEQFLRQQFPQTSYAGVGW